MKPSLKHVAAACIAFSGLTPAVMAGPQQIWTTTIVGLGGAFDEPAFLNKTVAFDSSGNALVTGYIDGTGSNRSGSDALIAKINPSGGTVWSLAVGGAGPEHEHFDSAVEDPATGDIYVTGTIGGGPGGFQEAVVVKLTSAGAYSTTWADVGYGVGVRRFGDGLSHFYGQKVIFDAATQNLLVGGYADTHLFVARFDAAGSFSTAWPNAGAGVGRRYFYPSGAAALNSSMARDSSGNIILGGGLARTATGMDFGVVKYSFSGSLLWDSYYSVNSTSSTFDFFQELCVDSAGNSYIIGQSFDTSLANRMAVVKWNSSGVQQWAKRSSFQGTGTSVKVDGTGLVYACGYDNANGGIVWKLTSAGTFSTSWANTGAGAGQRRIGGASFSTLYSLYLTSGGAVYVTGRGVDAFLSDGICTARINATNGTKIWYDVDTNFDYGRGCSLGINASGALFGFAPTATTGSGSISDIWISRYTP